jgi:hypothetical protein
MVYAAFEQDVYIAAPPETVRSFLAETTNLSEIHPYIVDVQHINRRQAPDGARIDYYRIRDCIKLGPLTICFTYRASASVSAAGELISDAYHSPGIHLHNVTTCREEGSGSRVKERIEITAPSLFMKTTYERAFISHAEMIANLKQVLEATQQTVVPQESS